MRNRTLALAAALLATAVALPASGEPPSAPGRPGGHPKAPDESGCRNVVDGFAAYQRLVQSIEQPEFAPGSSAVGMYQHRVVTVRDKGVATAGLVLEAPSCPDVVYTLAVYHPKTLALLATHSQAGDGTTGTEAAPLMVEAVVAGHPTSSVAMTVTTTSGGVQHDVAPKQGTAVASAPEDGLPGGGANSSFK